MKKNWKRDEKFAEIPFKEIKKATICFKAIDHPDAVFLQYSLLNEECVLRAFVDSARKQAKIFYNPKECSQKKLLSFVPKKFGGKILKEEKTTYKALLEKTFNI